MGFAVIQNELKRNKSGYSPMSMNVDDSDDSDHNTKMQYNSSYHL